VYWGMHRTPDPKDDGDYELIAPDVAPSNPFVRPERPAAEKTVPVWAKKRDASAKTSSDFAPAAEEPAEAAPAEPAAPTAAGKPAEMEKAEKPEPSPRERFLALIAEGKELRNNGDAVDALVKLREATALQPEDPEGMAELALTFERLKLIDRATEQWQRILDIGESAGSYYLAAENRIKAPLSHAAAEADVPRLSPGRAVLAPAPAPAPAPEEAAPPAPSVEKAPVPVLIPGNDAVSSLKPEALLGVGVVEREDDLDQVGKKLTLRIQLKARLGAHVNVSDVDISVLLYDEQTGGAVARTDADVSYRFADPPVNWANGSDETIEVLYDRTNTPPAKGKRKFFGYIVRIYHKGELQDVRAEPGLLAVKFPALQQISTDSNPAPSTRSRSRK